MEKIEIEYKGKKYPAYEVEMSDVYNGINGLTLVSNEDLFNATYDDVMNGEKEASNLDNKIWFYCQNYVFENELSYKQLIKYLKNAMKC